MSGPFRFYVYAILYETGCVYNISTWHLIGKEAVSLPWICLKKCAFCRKPFVSVSSRTAPVDFVTFS